MKIKEMIYELEKLEAEYKDEANRLDDDWATGVYFGLGIAIEMLKAKK